MADGLKDLLKACSVSAITLNDQLRIVHNEAEAGNWGAACAEAATASFLLGETTTCHQDVSRDNMLSFAESLGRAINKQNLDEVERVLRGIEENFPGVQAF